MKDFILETNDDTYIYGGLKFSAIYNEGKFMEPFIHIDENSRTVKFYRDKGFFIIYNEGRIEEIIFTMTCWSDDFRAYKVNNNNFGYLCTECYHGRIGEEKACNFNFSKFIARHGL